MPQRRHITWHQSFQDRAALPGTSPLAAYLFRLMVSKQTNLCLSADVTTTSELLDLAEECGDSICILKTHCDIVSDFGQRTVKGLLEIAKRKRFLIFEDRKFGDIGNTVQAQYAAGTHRIASWATITNAHIFPGPAIITALKSAAESAISSTGSSVATEIYGGNGPPTRLPGQAGLAHRSPQLQRSDEGEDDDGQREEEGEDDNDNESTSEVEGSDGGRESPRPTRTQQGEGRKRSDVSISTTISSSMEYMPPPAGSTGVTRAGVERASVDQAPVARGLLLLAQMSSADNLFTEPYTSKCVELARSHRDFVMGFIAQEALNRVAGDNFIVMTPGINMPASSSRAEGAKASSSRLQEQTGSQSKTSAKQGASAITSKGDALGQQYNDPRSVILDKGVDVIIVGRGILNAEDSEREAERYRVAGWRAIVERWGGKA